MHAQRIVVAIGAGVGVICTFLPWARVPLFGSVSGTEINSERAWASLALCSVVLLVALLGTAREPLAGGAALLCVLAGLATSGIAVWTIIELVEAVRDGGVQLGAGLYLLAVAGLVITFAPDGVRRVAPGSGVRTAPESTR
jgi:hypothetical protein